MLWGEDDYAGRWIQGIIAILLAICSIGGLYMIFNCTGVMLIFGGFAVTLGCIRLCWKCANMLSPGRAT